jgi:hypothetical protein
MILLWKTSLTDLTIMRIRGIMWALRSISSPLLRTEGGVEESTCPT